MSRRLLPRRNERAVFMTSLKEPRFQLCLTSRKVTGNILIGTGTGFLISRLVPPLNVLHVLISCFRKGKITENQHEKARGNLKAVADMIYGLVKSSESRVYEAGEKYGVD